LSILESEHGIFDPHALKNENRFEGDLWMTGPHLLFPIHKEVWSIGPGMFQSLISFYSFNSMNISYLLKTFSNFSFSFKCTLSFLPPHSQSHTLPNVFPPQLMYTGNMGAKPTSQAGLESTGPLSWSSQKNITYLSMILWQAPASENYWILL
jgi:hypothetical protein